MSERCKIKTFTNKEIAEYLTNKLKERYFKDLEGFYPSEMEYWIKEFFGDKPKLKNPILDDPCQGWVSPDKG